MSAQPILPTLSAPASSMGPGVMLCEDRVLPLQGIKARARICADGARTIIEQRFFNPHAEALEVVYIFPLPHSGAVTRFEMRIGERVITGQCQEREAAEAAYGEAVRAGHRAALMTEERGNVYTMKVANIPTGAIIKVRLEVIERLEEQDGMLRWRFPTVVAPRYMPGVAVAHEGPGAHPDTDQVPDASRLSPPILLGGGAPLDLEVTVDWMPASVASSLHAISLQLGTSLRVAPTGQAGLDRDFLLAIAPPPTAGIALQAWTDGQATAVRVLPPAWTADRIPRDAIFLVDISGSMGGSKMDAAKRALRLALRSLDEGDRLNVLAFDDRVEPLFSTLTDFNDATLTAADAWVQRLRARGGTRMAPALEAALAGDRPAGRVRTVLLITDAQVGNDDALVALVRSQGRGAVLTAVGIDTAVNASLMTRLARAGDGTSTLLTPRDDIEAAISNVEARFGAPLASGLVVEGGEAARPDPFSLFAGCPRVIYLKGAPAQVSVPGLGLSVVPEVVDFPIATLWAQARIDWWMDQSAADPDSAARNQAQIVALAVKHQLSTRFTAWVAIDTSATISGERRTIVQPVMLPADWSADAVTGALPPAPMPSMPSPMAAMASPRPVRTREAKRKARAPSWRSKRAGPLPGAPFGAADAVEAPMLEEGHTGAPAPALDFDDEAPHVDALLHAPPAPAPAALPRSPARRLQSKAAAPAPVASLSALLLEQRASGSWGDDPDRTAAALLALVLAGHTRRVGVRRRAVEKAARWLARNPGRCGAAVLAALERAEQGADPRAGLDVAAIAAAGRVDVGLFGSP